MRTRLVHLHQPIGRVTQQACRLFSVWQQPRREPERVSYTRLLESCGPTCVTREWTDPCPIALHHDIVAAPISARNESPQGDSDLQSVDDKRAAHSPNTAVHSPTCVGTSFPTSTLSVAGVATPHATASALAAAVPSAGPRTFPSFTARCLSFRAGNLALIRPAPGRVCHTDGFASMYSACSCHTSSAAWHAIIMSTSVTNTCSSHGSPRT
eukprot:CAMPEP_0116841402 /NCGR_PEP_ID=MMETSP0418-20121206/10905_1 /TAXON_ID=1158023 /ORGANISM="Astrosyne radiata, Strain 13vi08-1A" /LENGTH=210 /DNA_ID=CAMNT_0004471825 /DNA_START=1795 /DNA_END=2428 /DNA_ORIENTATION=+